MNGGRDENELNHIKQTTDVEKDIKLLHCSLRRTLILT